MLLFVDNIFRSTQVDSKTSTLLVVSRSDPLRRHGCMLVLPTSRVTFS